jgi:hypothetical protein
MTLAQNAGVSAASPVALNQSIEHLLLNLKESVPAAAAMTPLQLHALAFEIILEKRDGNYYVRDREDVVNYLRNTFGIDTALPLIAAAAQGVLSNISTERNPAAALQQSFSSSGSSITRSGETVVQTLSRLANRANEMSNQAANSQQHETSPISNSTQPVYSPGQLSLMETNAGRHSLAAYAVSLSGAGYNDISISLAIDRFPQQNLSHAQARSILSDANLQYSQALNNGIDVSNEPIHLGLLLPVDWKNSAGEIDRVTYLPATLRGTTESIAQFLDTNPTVLAELFTIDSDLGITPIGIENRLSQIEAIRNRVQNQNNPTTTTDTPATLGSNAVQDIPSAPPLLAPTTSPPQAPRFNPNQLGGTVEIPSGVTSTDITQPYNTDLSPTYLTSGMEHLIHPDDRPVYDRTRALGGENAARQWLERYIEATGQRGAQTIDVDANGSDDKPPLLEGR